MITSSTPDPQKLSDAIDAGFKRIAAERERMGVKPGEPLLGIFEPGYRPPSVADGTVSEELVRTLRYLADEFGPAGVASTVRELWPELGNTEEQELRRRGAVSILAMLCEAEVFTIGSLPNPAIDKPGHTSYVAGVLDVYQEIIDLIDRRNLRDPISEATPSDEPQVGGAS